MELNPENTKTPEITLFEIINDEKRKENHVKDQFFRSLLGAALENAVLRGELSTTREIADLRIRIERLEKERGQRVSS